MKLDLEKVWEIMNKLSNKMEELSENNKYVYLLGNSSEYHPMEFDSFLDYYSFKIDGEHIIVFNTDPIPYEDYSMNDFSSFPLSLLSLSEKDLNTWIENEIERQLNQQEINKISEKEDIKRQIESLTKKLNNYA